MADLLNQQAIFYDAICVQRRPRPVATVSPSSPYKCVAMRSDFGSLSSNCGVLTWVKNSLIQSGTVSPSPIRFCTKTQKRCEASVTCWTESVSNFAFSRGSTHRKRERPARKRHLPMAIAISLCVIFQILFYTPVSCDNTVSTGQMQCYSACTCIFGKDSNNIMNELLKDERQKELWDRTWEQGYPSTLQVYFCTDNGYVSVPNGVPSHAGALYLDNNEIDALTTYSFFSDVNQNVTSPTVLLSLTSNKIATISTRAFRGLDHVRTLSLRNNSLSSLAWMADGLPNMPFLSEIDISFNKINEIRRDSFGKFNLLQRLDLSNNEIKFVDSNGLLNLTSLEYLELSSNSITQTSFQSTPNYLTSVKYLYLRHNMISDIRPIVVEFLNRFPSLLHLDLAGNYLLTGKLESELFRSVTSLKTLNLSDCGISSISQGWLNAGPYKSLEILDLSSNELSQISAYALSVVFSGDMNSSPIGVRGANTLFHEVTAATSDSTGFGVQIVIPTELVERKWLLPLPSLKTIVLKNNKKLVTIEDDTFDYLPKLQHLFLQDCAIRRMNIASARYRYEANAVAKTLPALTQIWIFGNPLTCDCYLRAVKEWSSSKVGGVNHEIDPTTYVSDNQVITVSVETAVCAHPITLVGKSVEETPSVAMTCPDEPRSIFVAMMIGPMTFAASIVLTVMCGSCHVFIMRMKKKTVLSYHAREEAARTPRKRRRRRAGPDAILSPIPWNSPASYRSERSPSPSQRFQTNVVLSHMTRAEVDPPCRTQSGHHLGVPTSMRDSVYSVDGGGTEAPRNRQSAGYCSGTDNFNQSGFAAPILVVSAAGENSVDFVKNKSDSESDSVIGGDSVRTRSVSSDIPFVDEQNPQAQFVGYKHRRLSSTRSDGSRDVPLYRAPSLPTLSATPYLAKREGSGEESELLLRTSDSCPAYGLVLPGHESVTQNDEETCL